MEVTAISEQQCSKVTEMLGRVGDRWTLRVIVTLRTRPLRFNQIRRTVDGISQQMLTRTLRALERDGMLTRKIFPTIPPQVEYALTPLGHSLLEPVMALGRWAQAHIPVIDAARAEYDRRAGG
jgi:DNA-binding HxlR family transcriptional regulator